MKRTDDKGIDLGPWLPTAANINALPDGVRSFIHNLETSGADPAGDQRNLVIARDTIQQLQALNVETEADLAAAARERDEVTRERDRLRTAVLITQGEKARADAAELALAKVQNAAKVLVAGADERARRATAHEPAARIAIATLGSEREMNAQLTARIEELEAKLAAAHEEQARLRTQIANAAYEAMIVRANNGWGSSRTTLLADYVLVALAAPPVAAPFAKCANGHVWTHDYGDDWYPFEGTPCDCGARLSGGRCQPSVASPAPAPAAGQRVEDDSILTCDKCGQAPEGYATGNLCPYGDCEGRLRPVASPPDEQEK